MNLINIFNKKDSYSINLENILNKIRIQNDIKDNLLYSNVKYRRMWDTSLINYDKKINLVFFSKTQKGKWTDFILKAKTFKDNNIAKINPFTIQELLSSKLRIALLLFWKDIANNLSSDTIFKLQLKLNI